MGVWRFVQKSAGPGAAMPRLETEQNEGDITADTMNHTSERREPEPGTRMRDLAPV